MTVFTDNPAGRLHGIMTRLRANQPNIPIPTAWHNALELAGKGGGTEDTARGLAETYRLIEVTKRELAVLPAEAGVDDYELRWVGPVSTAIRDSFFSSSPVNQIIGKYSQAELNCLESCSKLLHRYRPEITLQQTELEKITELVFALEADLEDPAIDQELRDFLLPLVRVMARAIRDYPVLGPIALRDASDQAVGAVMRNTDLVERHKEQPAAKKFWELLGHIALALNIVLSVANLETFVQLQLESPAPVQDIVVIPQQPTKPGGSREAAVPQQHSSLGAGQDRHH